MRASSRLKVFQYCTLSYETTTCIHPGLEHQLSVPGQ
jgi:hypothetical protein